MRTTQLIWNFGKPCKAQANTPTKEIPWMAACWPWRISFSVLLLCVPCLPTVFLDRMGNHNTSLSSTIITILLSSERESDTFSKTFQITPLLGFSTKPFRANLCFVLVSLNRLDVTWACKKCLLLSCQSVLVVSAERAWLELAGLEGSYHSCQTTDSLTPTLPTSSYCIWFLLSSLDLS